MLTNPPLTNNEEIYIDSDEEPKVKKSHRKSKRKPKKKRRVNIPSEELSE
jgi:rRNA processing protein Gar1